MSETGEDSLKKLEKIASARKKLKQYQSKAPKSKESLDENLNNCASITQATEIIDDAKEQHSHAPHIISLQEFSSDFHSVPSDEQLYTEQPTAPIEFASIDPFQQFNAINMSNSFQSNSSGPSLLNYFSVNPNSTDFFGSLRNTEESSDSFVLPQETANQAKSHSIFDSVLNKPEESFTFTNDNIVQHPQPINSLNTAFTIPAPPADEISVAPTFPDQPQQAAGFFDSFHSLPAQATIPTSTESQANAISFFSSNASHLNPFNILSLPENNSETISTISERTENDSSLGKREEDEDISNSESLNQLSAQLSSILLAEDKILLETEATQNSNSLQNNMFDMEQKNQELQLLLQSEKIQNEELQFKVQNQSSTIEELRIEIQKLHHEKSINVGVDVHNLQEQLQNHIKTVGILVGEKSELTASLNKSQTLIKDKTIEVDELQSRLSASRHKVQELEKELNQSKISCDRLSSSQQKLLGEMEQFQEEINRLTTLYKDFMEENGILNQRLNVKAQDIKELQDSLTNKTSEVNMLQLRVEQLQFGNSNTVDESQIIAFSRQKETYEQQIQEYQQLVEQLKLEKDQTSQHYQNYLQNLNNQTTNLSTRVQELSFEKEKLVRREDDLVRHIGELEKNLQQQLNIEKQPAIAASVDVVLDEQLLKECTGLKSRVTELENENVKNLEAIKFQYDELQLELQDKNEKLSNMELTIERLQCERPDASKIMATIESEKVAASRAVSQNVELKNQLAEMQLAFVQISNDKLEITDKLQTEQHLCREMKIKFTEMETDLTQLKEKFNFKDTEMIRLAHENSELNKQIFQQNQELDRMRHYEAKNHLGSVLQTELQNSNDQIAYLRSRIKEMEAQKKLATEGVNEAAHIDNAEEITEESMKEISENEEKQEKEDSEEESLLSTSNFMIASTEAMDKLQERFRKTMDEIADLTEEKQKLEHLVLQLQGETETIGEYVALYQTQRRLLKQREIEKDNELRKLADDREQMKDKLSYLNSLIEQLLHEKGVESISPQHLNGHSHINSENNHDHTHEHHFSDNHNTTVVDTTQTAVEILNLLEEIKVINSTMDSLQHCPCCSGQLETV